MADWSQLPKELLQVIAERLEREGEFYVLRFRSVCSSWRSSVPIKHHALPERFPILSNEGTSDANGSFYLSKRSIFLVDAPRTLSRLNPVPWLVKIEEDDQGRKKHLNLFSRYQIKPSPVDFPKVLDIYELPVLELAQEYVLNPQGFQPLNSLEYAASLYREKVVFMWLNSEREQFVLLTIHVSGKLAFFKSGDKEWTIIPYMFTPYDDVIAFKGKFYAVDNVGRIVVVGLDSNVSLVAEPVFGGDKKLLVESDGDLLLVDKYLSSVSDHSSISDEFEEENEGSACERAARFFIFKLEEEANRWLALKSLEDWVLFLGDDCTFSASVSDLSISKGNCILFKDDFLYLDGEQSGIGFFDLDNGKISPFSDCPGYFKLCWRMPDWVKLLRQTERLEELTL